MNEYVVIYIDRRAVVINADNVGQAETRALAVLRNGRPDRDVTVEKVKKV